MTFTLDPLFLLFAAADCGIGPAWHFDDAQNPTAALHCPDACGDDTTRFDDELGCETDTR